MLTLEEIIAGLESFSKDEAGYAALKAALYVKNDEQNDEQNAEGKPVLFDALEAPDLLKKLENFYPKDESGRLAWYKVLQIQDWGEKTIWHYAVTRPQNSGILDTLFDLYLNDKNGRLALYETLKIIGNTDKEMTVWMLAAEAENYVFMEKLQNFCLEDTDDATNKALYESLNTLQYSLDNIWWWATRNSKFLTLLLKIYSGNDLGRVALGEALTALDNNNETVWHQAAPYPESLQLLLDNYLINDGRNTELFNILQIKSPFYGCNPGYTVWHYAVHYLDFEVGEQIKFMNGGRFVNTEGVEVLYTASECYKSVKILLNIYLARAEPEFEKLHNVLIMMNYDEWSVEWSVLSFAVEQDPVLLGVLLDAYPKNEDGYRALRALSDSNTFPIKKRKILEEAVDALLPVSKKQKRTEVNPPRNIEEITEESLSTILTSGPYAGVPIIFWLLFSDAGKEILMANLSKIASLINSKLINNKAIFYDIAAVPLACAMAKTLEGMALLSANNYSVASLITEDTLNWVIPEGDYKGSTLAFFLSMSRKGREILCAVLAMKITEKTVNQKVLAGVHRGRLLASKLMSVPDGLPLLAVNDYKLAGFVSKVAFNQLITFDEGPALPAPFILSLNLEGYALLKAKDCRLANLTSERIFNMVISEGRFQGFSVALMWSVTKMGREILTANQFRLLGLFSSIRLNQVISGGTYNGFSLVVLLSMSPEGRKLLGANEAALAKKIARETLYQVVPTGPMSGRTVISFFSDDMPDKTLLSVIKGIDSPSTTSLNLPFYRRSVSQNSSRTASPAKIKSP